MLDFPLMLMVKLHVVDRIQPQSNKFATGAENKAIGDLKLNESPCNKPRQLKYSIQPCIPTIFLLKTNRKEIMLQNVNSLVSQTVPLCPSSSA